MTRRTLDRCRRITLPTAQIVEAETFLRCLLDVMLMERNKQKEPLEPIVVRHEHPGISYQIVVTLEAKPGRKVD